MSYGTAHSNAQAELNRRTHLGPIAKTVYGSGALVDGMTSTAVNTFLFFYMTAVCGLSGSLAGASLVVALLIDSVADPLIGSLSDNTHSRFGRRHPWMLAGSLPLFVSLGLLFSAPEALKGWPLFIYLTAAAVGTRVSLSLFTLPHAALGAELSDDYAERSNLVAHRLVYSIIAAITCPALVYVVFMPQTNELLHRAGFVPFGWACAGVALLGALVSTFGTRETLSRLHQIARPEGHPLLRFFREMREIFKSRSFLILFIGSLLYFISSGLTNSLGLHNNKFFWNFSNPTLQMLAMVGAAGSVLGIPLASWLQRFIDKPHLLMITLTLTCAGSGLVPLMRIFDMLPANGPGLLIPMIVFNFLNGIAQILIAVTYYSMTGDAADEHEYLFGSRREGLYFAGLSFSSKAASALGAFIAGIAMDAIHFPSDIAAKGANFHIPARTIIELALVNGPGAALVMSLAAILILFNRVDRGGLARIQAALSERRKAAAAESSPTPPATANADRPTDINRAAAAAD